MLPLVNVPMIDYVLEFLAIAGVEEIFVFCNSHADQIRAHVAQSRLGKNNKVSPKVHCLLAPNTYSVGDVLRELDGKGLIRNDFVLISGNVVSNMKLGAVVDEHRARRSQNKDTIMTSVMKKASTYHRTRALSDKPLLAIDPMNSECLMYDVIPSHPTRRKVQIETSLFKKRRCLQIRNDLIDCQIDICSPEVLALFTENFDYQDLRKDFVKGILTSDLYGKSIHVHIIESEYAASVSSTLTYDSVSRDIIERWSFPMVPDSNIFDSDLSSMKYLRGHNYKGSDVTLAHSSRIGSGVVIGHSSTIDENSCVIRSVIGPNGKIGRNVVMEDAYIWGDVVIEDDCTIRRSIIANGACIKRGVTVERGSIISFNSVISSDKTVPMFSRLTTQEPPENRDEDLIKFSNNTYLWQSWWDHIGDDDDEPESFYEKMHCIGVDENDIGNSGNIEEFLYSDSEDESSDDDDEETQMRRHVLEVKESISRAIMEGHNVENAILELNGLKMACNLQLRDIPPVIIPEILAHVDSGNFKTSFQKVMSKWVALISKFAISEPDKIECLTLTWKYCKTCDPEYGSRLFKSCIEGYYYYDFVEDADIFRNWLSLGLVDKTSNEYKYILALVDLIEESDSESDD